MTPQSWMAEAHDLAGRLRALAASTPSFGSTRRCTEVATELCGDDVMQAQAVFQHLQEAREREGVRRIEAAETHRSAAEAEQCHSEALAEERQAEGRVSAARAEAAAAREAEHWAAQSRMAQVGHKLAAAGAAATAAAQARCAGREARQVELAQLRESVEEHRREAQVARAEVEQTAVLREQATQLPTLLERLREVRDESARAEGLRAQAQRDVEGERSKLDAASLGSGAKTEALAARVAQLEQECLELQQGKGREQQQLASSAQETASSPSQLDLELKAVQESNKRLTEEIRRLRTSQKAADGEFEIQRRGVEAAQAACGSHAEEQRALELQLRELAGREREARSEVERLRSQISQLEQQAHAKEEAAHQAREKHRTVDGKREALVLARRQANEAASVLEWRLQKAMAQLDKERPRAPIVRCIGSRAAAGPRVADRLGAGATGQLLGTARQKKLDGPPAVAGGSDADGDSTTAGESLAEGLP